MVPSISQVWKFRETKWLEQGPTDLGAGPLVSPSHALAQEEVISGDVDKGPERLGPEGEACKMLPLGSLPKVPVERDAPSSPCPARPLLCLAQLRTAPAAFFSVFHPLLSPPRRGLGRRWLPSCLLLRHSVPIVLSRGRCAGPGERRWGVGIMPGLCSLPRLLGSLL